MKKKRKKAEFLPDVENNGRDQLFLDVDRFINEGMSGGTVFRMETDDTNIEEARDFFEEEKPNHN